MKKKLVKKESKKHEKTFQSLFREINTQKKAKYPIFHICRQTTTNRRIKKSLINSLNSFRQII